MSKAAHIHMASRLISDAILELLVADTADREQQELISIRDSLRQLADTASEDEEDDE